MSDLGGPVTEQGKLWAALSYGSFFIGFPLGIIPMIQRDDAYALYHAKHATAVWLAVFVATSVLGILYPIVSMVTCGFGAILFPMLLLPVPWALVVGIHGLVIAMNGEWQEPVGAFGLGEMMFGSIRPKAIDTDLPPPPPRSPPPPPPPPIV